MQRGDGCLNKELKTVGLLLKINGFVLLLAIYLDCDDSNQGEDLIDNCKFLLERAIARNLYNSSKLIYVAVLGREAMLLYTWL